MGKPTNKRFDYVIVGGGTAGCVLANRLSANPSVRVCLLEAGPADNHPLINMPVGIVGLMRHRRLNWSYWTEPQPHLNNRRLFWPRGKTLGGSSATNAMIYTRGHPWDYDHWASLGNGGWSYRELLPYFRAAEHFDFGSEACHGRSGPLNITQPRSPNPLSRAFVEAVAAVGHRRNDDFNGAEQEGAGLYPLAQRNGSRCSNSHAYLRPAFERPNLTIVTEARACAVQLSGRRAVGVSYLHRGALQRVEAAHELLLCGGAINSPQLLLLSGIGPRRELERHGVELRHHLPGVGENLQDHLGIAVIHRARSRAGISLGPHHWWRAARGLGQYLRSHEGEFTSNFAEAGAFVRSSPFEPRPNLQFHFLPAICEQHGLYLRESLRGYGYTLRGCTLRPQSRGRVSLRSANPVDPPRIDPSYLAHSQDLDESVRAVQMAREILLQAPFDPHFKFELRPGADVRSDDELRAYVRAHAESIYHPVGSCKMGQDSMAVVDAQLRVHGLEGLRVIDASIMPTIIGGGTNAPTTAIAEKAAALILGTERTKTAAA